MNRREYLSAMGGGGLTAVLAGCSGSGQTLLRKKRVTATSPSKEWELELEADSELELVVRLKDGMTANGYVHRKSDGTEIAGASPMSTGDTAREKFTVPTTGVYLVSIEVGGSTGEIIVREG